MSVDHFNHIRRVSRNISLIENRLPGSDELLTKEHDRTAKIIGITGAPGSGKSTLTDALIREMVNDDKKVAVLCVDPSSPFHKGALLGDRIRMSEWYNHPDVFIRSLSSRGSLGGLHPSIIEITEYLKGEDFDFLIIETVGVGQSEIDIAALADLTVLVLVPEGGDSVQNMKSGVMEIADVFVVNKSDRPGADQFAGNLRKMIGPSFRKEHLALPVLQVTAVEGTGVAELYQHLKNTDTTSLSTERKQLLAQKSYLMLQSFVMKSVDQNDFENKFFERLREGDVNLYAFARQYAEGL